MGHWFGDSTIDLFNTTNMINRTHTVQIAKSIPFSSRKFATIVTVLGVVLLDLDCDACQSPSRAYLLDVTDPSQHSLGLTTFTSMAGLGGCLGYFLGGIPWENTFLGKVLGDHVHVLFSLVWMIYLVCLFLTVTTAKEPNSIAVIAPNLSRSSSRQYLVSTYSTYSMSNLSEGSEQTSVIKREQYHSTTSENFKVSYCDYLRSIIYMPASLRWLCLTNFFCWMALVSYSLYFTDFVGQAVFGKQKKNFPQERSVSF